MEECCKKRGKVVMDVRLPALFVQDQYNSCILPFTTQHDVPVHSQCVVEYQPREVNKSC